MKYKLFDRIIFNHNGKMKQGELIKIQRYFLGIMKRYIIGYIENNAYHNIRLKKNKIKYEQK